MQRARFSCALLLVICQSVACGQASDSVSATMPIRLVDAFNAKLVTGGGAPVAVPVKFEWRFSATPAATGPLAPTHGWEAGVGVSGLAIKDGLLMGRTTDPVPILRVERTSGLDSADQVHSIEVRMRASDGANVSVQTNANANVDFKQVVEGVRRNPWPMSSPLQSGNTLQTYTFVPLQTVAASRVRHLMIRPTDVAGADFAIESVRLILRAEHLASVPSGIGWQGLGEVYRETLVARSPETLRFDVQLPDRPWLDLAVGTVAEHPVTFRVAARRAESSAAPDAAVDLTVTTAHRWQTFPQVDLSSLAGQRVTLELALVAETPATLGFWGAPVVRSHEAAPRVAEHPGLGAPPRGVILIQTDTLRRDHLEAYGYARKTAPTIARLAREGVLFGNAISQAAWTKASTPSVMTSLYPSTGGVQRMNDRMPSSATTLAEAYRAAGYATLSLAANAFVGQFTNLHQGFEELHENGSLGPPNTPFRMKTAREYVDRATDWLARHRDGPFFVYLHMMDPHSPYEPYPPYNALWADPSKKEEHQRQVRELTKIITDPSLRSLGLPKREDVIKGGFDPAAFIQHEIDWYDGSIRAMDAEIGRLIERLAMLGLDQNALVVLFSDHGEEFHDHGGMFHEHSVYGELTNVPLIAWWRGGLPAGRSVGENVQLIDIMPTLLDVSRLQRVDGLQGQSLLPLLTGNSTGGEWKPRPAISEAESIIPNPGPARTFSSRAIIDGQWKLIYNRHRREGQPEYELYDQLKDPINKHDVAAENPAIVSRLSKALEGWGQMSLAARLKPDAETTKGLSAEELQRLRSLGYVR